MKIRSKLLLSNFVVVFIALSITLFFVYQLLAIQELAIYVSQNLKSNGIDLNDSIQRVIFVFILGILAFLILAYLFIWNFSKIFVKPLNELQQATKEITGGDLTRKVDVNSKDEFKDLANSFNLMTSKLKDTIEGIEATVQERTVELEKQKRSTLVALQNIREEKAEKDALLVAIGEGIIATDINAHVIFINPTAEQILGWKASEIIGKRIYDFLKMVDENGIEIPEQNRPIYLALKIGQKVVGSVQETYYYVKQDGGKIPVSIAVTPVKLGGQLVGAINVFRDIVREKAVDRVKTEFVSLASHQLRTPLSSINWYVEMLLSGDAGKITKKQKECLEEIFVSNKRMSELVGSLLNVSRLELGIFAVNIEDCDVEKICKSVFKEMIHEVKLKKIKIFEKYDENLQLLKTDKKLLRIIVQNLLSNSIKYTPEKGNVYLLVEQQEKDIMIEVKDTGYGVPQKDQQKIFQKLFRAENVKKKTTDGTGLGLYIVKSIVEQLGGKIWFISEENKGTDFFVTLPISGVKSKERKSLV
jgi:PAS domain S-box-containing protein